MADEWGFYPPGIMLDSVDAVMMNTHICHHCGTLRQTTGATDEG